MWSEKRNYSHTNRARRHFLGAAAAASAKLVAIAAAVSPSAAHAVGNKWWRKGGGPRGGPNCFLRGTAITTPSGAVNVEDLRIGDFVQTVRGPAMPVKWIGHRRYHKTRPYWNTDILPIRIAQHALDDATPSRDLYISAGHALLINGMLIRALDLVNGTTITRVNANFSDIIEYFHIVFDGHEVILAENAPAESFQVSGDNYEQFANFTEYTRQLDAGPRPEMISFAPVISHSGRTHLLALLRLANFPFATASESLASLDEVYEKIAARGREMAR